MVDPLEEASPGLSAGGYRVTSPRSKRYNCIAWAAGDTGSWWWPVPEVNEVFWPAGAPRAETLDAFREAFTSLGYAACEGVVLEPGFEKIALFADDRGVPLHAARQLASGRWTSKIGELEDVEHRLRDVEGDLYGTLALIMKRPAEAAGPTAS